MENNQKEILNQFYNAFSHGDYKRMNSFYHPEATFEDPAFGKLSSTEAKAMWKMLLSTKEESKFKVEFTIIDESEATWKASYLFGKSKNQVINNVTSTFEFKDGLIIKHEDDFNLWKWTKQALGISGMLLGWSNFMKNKIQQTTKKRLTEFIKSNQ